MCVCDCIFSDHHPISFTIDINIIPIMYSKNNEIKYRFNWEKLYIKNINEYKASINIHIPDGTKYVDANYVNTFLANDANYLYGNIYDFVFTNTRK